MIFHTFHQQIIFEWSEYLMFFDLPSPSSDSSKKAATTPPRSAMEGNGWEPQIKCNFRPRWVQPRFWYSLYAQWHGVYQHYAGAIQHYCSVRKPIEWHSCHKNEQTVLGFASEHPINAQVRCVPAIRKVTSERHIILSHYFVSLPCEFKPDVLLRPRSTPRLPLVYTRGFNKHGFSFPCSGGTRDKDALRRTVAERLGGGPSRYASGLETEECACVKCPIDVPRPDLRGDAPGRGLTVHLNSKRLEDTVTADE